MKNLDLFGNEVEVPDPPKGRKKTPRMQQIFGTADGKTCRDCAHCFAYTQSRTWYKCELWLKICFPNGGHSEASDIRLKDTACGKYECLRRKMMPDREKVIRGLEAHANPKTCETCAGEDCPYYNRGGSYTEATCSSFLAADALALLRKQEPRVLEYSEIEGCPLVWLEDIDKEDVLPALDLEHSGEDVLFVRKATDPYYGSLFHCETFYAYEEDYGTRWRAWTARPTEEQRKAVKWDG